MAVLLSIQVPENLMREIDAAASCAGRTRSDWARGALREGLAASRDARSRPPAEVMRVAVSVGTIAPPPGYEGVA